MVRLLYVWKKSMKLSQNGWMVWSQTEHNRLARALSCYASARFTQSAIKGKGFPYSLSTVGPEADSGVQAVSPQEPISHSPVGRLSLHSARPAVTFPAWRQTHIGVNCEQLAQCCYAAFAPSRIWTHDLLIASPPRHSLQCCNSINANGNNNER